MKTICVLLAAIASVSVASAQTPAAITTGGINLQLQTFASISGTSPQELTNAGDGSGRLFVTTRNGQVRVLNKSGGFLDSTATPYLNLASYGINTFTQNEGGFSGLAFSPNFATNGKFFTVNTDTYQNLSANFSHPEMGAGGITPSNTIVLREWTVSNPASNNPTISSTGTLMRINHPQGNHQGGALKFGPDGNLYMSLGDGGGANDNAGGVNALDGHTNATGNAQDLSVVFGKILRITPNNAGGYTVPASNPFLSNAAAVPEIYAYGLRNPYRMSFDRGNGNLLVGDVGEGGREEVDIITSGGNFGWVYREGTDNNFGGGRTPVGGFNSFQSIDPVSEYTHSDGISIIGGYVYRGTAVPELAGKYIFGDFVGNGNGARIFYSDALGGPITEFTYLSAVPGNIYGFGEGEDGQLYALFANGQIRAIVPEPSSLALLAGAGLMALRRRR